MEKLHKVIPYNKNLTNYSEDEYKLINIYLSKIRERNIHNKIEFMKFKTICSKFKYKLRELKTPFFPKISEKSSILIDNRKNEIIEFLLKINIVKLGPEFSHFVVCFDENYTYIKNIVNKISNNINLVYIKNYSIKSINDYNRLLVKKHFWERFNTKKVLLYQIDSYLFNTENLEYYWKYNYLGAVWPHCPMKLYVGNGGFSIRSIDLMLKVCDYLLLEKNKKIIRNIESINEDIAVGIYLKENNMTPDIESCLHFSIENICPQKEHKCIGGHQFWFSMKDWEIKVKKNIEELINNYIPVEPKLPLPLSVSSSELTNST